MRRCCFVLTLAAIWSGSIGCASTRGDRAESLADPSVASALTALSGNGAPERFAKVGDRLYRGGQPTAEHLRLLHAVGVTKIVDLRRERLGVRRAEWASARELGMELVELPFYGVFGAEPEFLSRAIEALHADDGGAVYVHCDNGRDRTSLVVALYRVVVDGWTAERAWKHEALAFGHQRTLVNREIELTFRERALEHAVRAGTLAEMPSRGREAADLGRSDTRVPVAGDRDIAMDR